LFLCFSLFFFLVPFVSLLFTFLPLVVTGLMGDGAAGVLRRAASFRPKSQNIAAPKKQSRLITSQVLGLKDIDNTLS